MQKIKSFIEKKYFFIFLASWFFALNWLSASGKTNSLDKNEEKIEQIVYELNQNIRMCLVSKGYSMNAPNWTVMLSDYNECMLIGCKKIHKRYGYLIYKLIESQCAFPELNRP